MNDKVFETKIREFASSVSNDGFAQLFSSENEIETLKDYADNKTIAEIIDYLKDHFPDAHKELLRLTPYFKGAEVIEEIKYFEGTHNVEHRAYIDEHGNEHSINDQPACTLYYEDGLPWFEDWYRHGRLHRDDDKPARKEYVFGKLFRETWCQNGFVHRDNDKPAYREYDPETGKVVEEKWYQYNKLCRNNDKPAIKKYYDDGKILQEEWYENNLLHRENDKPAIIQYHENGNISWKRWYYRGEQH